MALRDNCRFQPSGICGYGDDHATALHRLIRMRRGRKDNQESYKQKRTLYAIAHSSKFKTNVEISNSRPRLPDQSILDRRSLLAVCLSIYKLINIDLRSINIDHPRSEVILRRRRFFN